MKTAPRAKERLLTQLEAPPKQRGPVTLMLALGLLLILVVGAVYVLTRPAPKPASQGAGSTAKGPAAGASANPASACSLPAGAQEVPTDTPTGITWTLADGWLLPSSATAGPTVQGPVPACFAHNPIGALLAAIRISDALLSTHPGDWLAVLKADFVPGAGTDAAITQSMAVPGPLGAMWVGPRTAQMAGFRFLAYSPDLAVVALLVRSTDTGALSTGTVTLAWSGGDWKVKPDDQGSVSGPQTAVASIVGWVEFRGA